ncbi:MAG: hypothetical protein AB1918_15030 [Pseudomonadota bacterium]
MEAWPSLLPLPSRDGYGVQPGEGILRTEMESGPARQEEIATDVPSQIPVTWHFSPWQYAIFEAWYKHRARQGAVWFEITLLSGLGLGLHEARFVRQYKSDNVSAALWVVKATLEIRERPTLDDQVLAIVLTEDAGGVMAAADVIHLFVHSTLPGQSTW